MSRTERFMQWLFEHSPVIGFHCAGFVVALVAGIMLGENRWGAQVSGVLAAFLGASMTVFGAVAYGEHQEVRRKKETLRLELKHRRDLIKICFDFLGEIGRATTMATGDFVADVGVSTAIQPILAQWETVAKFEPFREIDDFFQIQSMLQVGAKCRTLARFAMVHDPHPRDARGNLLGRDEPLGGTPASLVNAIEEDCRRLLQTFHGMLDELDVKLEQLGAR